MIDWLITLLWIFSSQQSEAIQARLTDTDLFIIEKLFAKWFQTLLSKS